MKRFVIEQTNADIVSPGGLALIGQAVKRLTCLQSALDKGVALRHGIKHSDVIKTYLGLLCIGKNDFEAINTIESENFFMTAMDVQNLPSEATLRQRFDDKSQRFKPLVDQAIVDFLVNSQPKLAPLKTGHVPIDADVSPFDNSRSRKEGVSRTYKSCDGYAPMIGYLGREGYCVEIELREGKQHCQNGTPMFLERLLKKARMVTDQPLLLRLDGGNDSIENVEVLLDFNEACKQSGRTGTEFIIKWNPRQEDKWEWLGYAEKHGHWTQNRDGKRTALFTVKCERQWKGYDFTMHRVMRVVERTIDRHGQHLLEPEIKLEGWWTNLDDPEETIIELYADHGTSEQYHSEFKTDLDIERLPSGKFNTNALVLSLSALAYNLLRWIGQNGLLDSRSPKRNIAQRRRLKTVMQELMYVAVRVVHSARCVKLQFGKGCRVVEIFSELYSRLAYS